ncbi:MAG: hypothetical protein JRJ85_08175 [Deltaproteobacteria bacterium]|nr:hypothetical protein [Deltaproteobacteria bacterium]
MHRIGMPERASTRNPIDNGAMGPAHEVDLTLAVGREALASGEIDALVLHGIGGPGMLDNPGTGTDPNSLDVEKRFIRAFDDLEKEARVPVLIGCHYTPWESQAVYDLNTQGIRIYNRVDEIAQILSLMYRYWKTRLP